MEKFDVQRLPPVQRLFFYDLVFLAIPPVQRLFFYDMADLLDVSDFTLGELPRFRDSLAAALHHFYPLAGKLTCELVDEEGAAPPEGPRDQGAPGGWSSRAGSTGRREQPSAAPETESPTPRDKEPRPSHGEAGGREESALGLPVALALAQAV
jgi:hypothetical protein